VYDTALAASPAATRLALPRWFDARMVVGILLVLASVVIGAKVFSSADASTSVWAVARDLPAGARLQAADLKAVKVRLADGREYVSAAGTAPVGYVLTRPVGAGELLPSKAFVDPAKATDPALVRREVTVPVRQDHWPADLRASEVVDVYATPTKADGGPPVRILAGVTVGSVPSRSRDVFGSSGESSGSVTLLVSNDQVAALVGAVESSQVDLVRVPSPLATSAPAGSG
jgi:SAF domain